MGYTAYNAKKTEHGGPKRGSGAYYGRKAIAKKASNRRRREDDRDAVSAADLETLPLGTSLEFLAIIERSRSRLKREVGISSDEIRRRLGLNK
jgi:hypothetical protein